MAFLSFELHSNRFNEAFNVCGYTDTKYANLLHPSRSSTSELHDVPMNEPVRSSVAVVDMPPGCQAISYSSWTRFSSSSFSSLSKHDFKSSTLCAGRGTTRDYNPPITEWGDTSADQKVVYGKLVDLRFPELEPKYDTPSQSWIDSSPNKSKVADSDWIDIPSMTCDAPKPRPKPKAKAHTKSKSNSKSKSQALVKYTSKNAYRPKSEPITFHKKPVKRSNTDSLLTQSFKAAEAARPKSEPTEVVMERITANLGLDLKNLSPSQLPSAFDSDSEDDFI